MLVIKLDNGNVYPADRCIWRTVDDPTGGYRLTHFTPNATSVAITATPAVAPAGARLGYIGKSGRFVSYTDPAV
jgi:hypothetical protein